MLQKRKTLADIINTYKEWSYGLFRASETACSMCERNSDSNSGDTRGELSGLLCRRCLAMIPWIDSPICGKCGRGEACPDCIRETKDRGFVCNRSASMYTPNMKAWLARYKFQGDERQSALLGAMLLYAYRKHYAAVLKPEAICYVPISRERLEQRGFNQAERLAREVGAQLQLPVWDVIVRRRQTAQQSHKSRSERLRIEAGMYEAAGADVHLLGSNPQPTLLIVDDVYTTGSTMSACANAIRKQAPAARIYGLTWAR